MENLASAVPEQLRLAESPRRSPHIVQAMLNSAKSMRPGLQTPMESINSQADVGLRTTDFFDDSSEDETTQSLEASIFTPEAETAEGRSPPTESREQLFPLHAEQLASRSANPQEASDIYPGSEGYQRLEPVLSNNAYTHVASSSFNGSADELIPDYHDTLPQMPRVSHTPSGRVSPGSQGKARLSSESFNVFRPSTVKHSSKIDEILGVHAIAYEIMLAALRRDEEAIGQSLNTLTPLDSDYPRSLVPKALRVSAVGNASRSPRARDLSTTSGQKKVQVVPPPIDTALPHPSLPDNIVRTPFPHWASNGQDPGPSTPGSAVESLLTLRIRRSNTQSKTRVTAITIPSFNTLSTVTNAIGEEQRYYSVGKDFDDAEFFHQLREAYKELIGARRFLSARALTGIVVSGPKTRAADAGYGWLHQPRSPRLLAHAGMSNIFSENRILQQYRNPAMGRSRYAFVQWAHHLAAAPAARVLEGSAEVSVLHHLEWEQQQQQSEGLEFVVSWSTWRIMSSLLLVIGLSMAVALLWIFLGKNTVGGPTSDGGFHDAGDRVGTGILMGICLLLLGLSGIAGWLGVSWLVV